MKKQKLVDAIDVVIAGLESETMFHKWSEYNSCNMGLIAQAITGKSGHQIINDLGLIESENSEEEFGSWSDYVGYFCPISGLSKVELFRILQEAGMSREDMMYLEYLSDPKVLARTNRVVTKQHYLLFGLGKGKIETYNYDITRYDNGAEDEDYYQDTDNFLLYLKKWKEILIEEESA